MFGIAYLKAPPTTYVLHYQRGRVKREGAGLSFLYYRQFSWRSLSRCQQPPGAALGGLIIHRISALGMGH